MMYFSRMKILFLFALIFPCQAIAFSFSFDPEISYVTETFKNSLSEQAPFQGFSYGFGMDFKFGSRHQGFPFLITAFWESQTLSNSAVTSEKQTATIIGY